MTSKQRAKLRKLATNLEPVFQIGKGNMGEELVKGIRDVLDKRELIKITVLKTAEKSAEEFAANLANILRAEVVASIGSKIILYRKSNNKDVEHIEID